MHMIRLRREFGFNSDLSARGECEIQFQDYSEAIVVSMVILEFQATGRLRRWQIELHVYDTLALWKDLGSGSDMTGSARWWIRFMREFGFNSDLSARGECEIQFQDYSEAIVVSMVILEFQATGPRLGRWQIELHVYDTLALWKDLGSGSDMTGSARWWIRVMREFGFNSDLSARGECEIQFQDYSEAIVVSMVILEFQATGPRLGRWQIELHVYDTLALWKDLGSGSDMTGSARWWIRVMREFGFNSDLSARGECEIQFQDYSEAIVVSMVILEFQATGPRLGRWQIELHVYDTLALWKDLGSGSDMTECKMVDQVYETLALRKELGSWSDVTECKMLEQGYETLALRKELGSWSDVTGVQDVGTGLWGECEVESQGLRECIVDINGEGEISRSMDRV
ncbi:Protein Kinase C Theta Type [Manis pentadactyla]|nr:Protein Kinase C Theta Type [Manis pentadactyla]